jgi:hypothetical protein
VTQERVLESGECRTCFRFEDIFDELPEDVSIYAVVENKADKTEAGIWETIKIFRTGGQKYGK